MAVCTVNEAHKTQRRLGLKKWWKRENKKDPMQKAITETEDLTQRVDWVGAESPRPM